jgi:hypothetical protein
VVPQNALFGAVSACLQRSREREFHPSVYRASLHTFFPRVQRRLVSWICKEDDTGRVDEIESDVIKIVQTRSRSQGFSRRRKDRASSQICSIQGFLRYSEVSLDKRIRGGRVVGKPDVSFAWEYFDGPSAV